MHGPREIAREVNNSVESEMNYDAFFNQDTQYSICGMMDGLSYVYTHAYRGTSEKGHCIINLSTKDTVRGPKNYMSYSFRTSNRGLKDKTAEFMLSPTCLLFGGSTVVFRSLECILYNVMRAPAYLGDIMSVFNLLGGRWGVLLVQGGTR